MVAGCLAGAGAFLWAWIYSINTYGFFLGVGLCWIPSLGIGAIVGGLSFLVWPIAALFWIIGTISEHVNSMSTGGSNISQNSESAGTGALPGRVSQSEIGLWIVIDNGGTGCLSESDLSSTSYPSAPNSNCKVFAARTEGKVIAVTDNAVEVELTRTDMFGEQDYWFPPMEGDASKLNH